jgi:Zn-dependent oligopeptidase
VRPVERSLDTQHIASDPARPTAARAGRALSFDVALEPELEAAMAEHRAEVDAIAAGPWPPGFDDTIAALERAGQRLHVAERLLDELSSTQSTAELRALDAQMLPRLAAHHDAIGLDPRVFARIADLAARRDTSTSTPSRPPRSTATTATSCAVAPRSRSRRRPDCARSTSACRR